MIKHIRIGLAVNHTYAYYRGVLRGIVRYAEAKPQWLFTSILPEYKSLSSLGRMRPAGIIVSIHLQSLVRSLSKSSQPVVNVSCALPNLRFPSVGVDNTLVGQLAANHFLDRGLCHFGFVGPPDHLYSIERQAAFGNALQAAGHRLAHYHSPGNRPVDPLGRSWNLDQGVYRWLRQLPKPLGLFTATDDWGVQASEICRKLGLRVPEDVAVLGVDNDDLDCELARPRLSSVIVPTERIGYEAAAMLDRLLAGEPPPSDRLLLPPTGVSTRRSTEQLAIDDLDVVAAVKFIRDHSHMPIRVTDVLREVPVGRRSLERRCQQALGWGLGEEIRRAHLDRAKRLLVRTDLPIKVVAQQAGYSSFRHMAVVFQQEIGCTPTDYRCQQRS